MQIKQTLRDLRAKAFKEASRSGKLISDETRAALEAFIEEWNNEYNSPEAEAERERKYQELRRIGELRRQAFENGQSMDEVAPLPYRPSRNAKYRPGMSIQEQVEAFINGDNVPF